MENNVEIVETKDILTTQEALSKTEKIKSYFSFSGRTGRKNFLLFMMVEVGIWIALGMLIFLSQHVGQDYWKVDFSIFFNILMILAVFITIVLMLAICVLWIMGFSFSVRRLHDLNLSGWWCLLLFVPLFCFILLMVLIFKKGDGQANRFGKVPL